MHGRHGGYRTGEHVLTSLGEGLGGRIRRGCRSGCAYWARRQVISAFATAVVLSAAACSASAGNGAAAKPLPPPAQLTITPANGAQHVRPGARVQVTAAGGTLRTVVVRTAGGQVPGQLGGSGTTWRSRGNLDPSRSYTVTATAANAASKTVTATSSFTTLKPKKTFRASITEGRGQQYGVGMPVILTFSRPITRKAAVEKALRLTTSKPVVGAWYWDGARTLVFRPRVYWPARTRVTVDGQFSGLEGGRGVYGVRYLRQTFEIGPPLIVVASTRTHYMKVYYQGRLFGRWPISTGRPGDDTANGTYVTIDKGNPLYFTGPGYALWVPWAVRITWSGTYIHDAYWSVWAQGHLNVSHGCINTSPAHAETYYKMEVPGDPVTVTGSPRPGTWANGWTEWFLSWKQLLKGSALHEAVVAGPHGSSFVRPASLPAPRAVAPLLAPRPHNAA